MKETEMTVLITRDDLRDAIDRGEVTVVDALPSSYYDQQHLPGAVNLFVDEAREGARDVLPDKDAPIVTYCSNEAVPTARESPGCWLRSATRTSASTARASRT